MQKVEQGFSQENEHTNFASEKPKGVVNLSKSIIYLDRNNTPDIWADIK